MAAVFASFRIRLQRDSLLPDASGGAWRVIVAVIVFQFFGGDIAVFQNVVDDRLRTFGGYRPCASDKFLWQDWLFGGQGDTRYESGMS